MGNPCASLQNYRSYVIGILPQLEILDGEEILYTERLAALQNFHLLRPQIEEEELLCIFPVYYPLSFQFLIWCHITYETVEETGAPWVVERAPEIRRQLRGGRESYLTDDDDQATAPTCANAAPLTNKSGRVLNSNQADVRFELREDQDSITLTVKLSKYINHY